MLSQLDINYSNSYNHAVRLPLPVTRYLMPSGYPLPIPHSVAYVYLTNMRKAIYPASILIFIY